MSEENYVWTPIPTYEGFYEITRAGDIRSLHPKEGTRAIKPRIDWGGYLAVCLCKRGEAKTKRIHRLVAETFIPKPVEKPFVNHKDGDKLNNHVRNLEWVTHSENLKHAHENGLIKPGKKKVRDLCSGKSFESVREAARSIGIAYSTLKNYLGGTRPNKTCLTYLD